MPDSFNVASQFGYLGLFAYMFVSQIGVPVPAVPVLLAVGAFIAAGKMSAAASIALAVFASFAADAVLYWLGRRSGNRILFLFCKLSFKPDACVTKTTNVFSRNGAMTLLFAKFVPALAVLAPSLAGLVKLDLMKFVLYDMAGSIIFVVSFVAAGGYAKEVYSAITGNPQLLLSALPWLCLAAIIIALLWGLVRRKNYRATLEAELTKAILPDEVQALIDQGAEVMIVDVRDELGLKARPIMIHGAKHLPHKIFKRRAKEFKTTNRIVVYCDCPEDQTAADLSRFLRQSGITNVQALKGGLDGWISKGFRTHDISSTKSETQVTQRIEAI